MRGSSSQLLLADWLEELAVFGVPRHMLAPETAHHLCQAIRHGYLVRLAIKKPRAVAPRPPGAIEHFDEYLRRANRPRGTLVPTAGKKVRT